MSENLKDIFFADSFLQELGTMIQSVYSQFDPGKFMVLVQDKDWGKRALKAKMRHLSNCLGETLPKDYPNALDILIKAAPTFHGFDAMVFPDYVECYGLDYFDLSMDALKFFTPLCSSEFAVRPYIAKDPERAMAYILVWAEDEDPHVRRLASEGCRPRLPWGTALKIFKADPTPILPVLEMLKDDPSEYVRRSVANNLNDISKDHPEVVLEVCQRWYGESPEVDRVVKHACRGLLKAGNRQALLIFDFADPVDIHVENLELDKIEPRIGEEVRITFKLLVEAKVASKVRLEYAVDYVKARGKKSRKIFQISERHLQPGEHSLSKVHSFVDRSTRKHYPGEHQITIIVNGIEKAEVACELLGDLAPRKYEYIHQFRP
jgi:3-methyladenine DNA glycosylase AlkC